jgi:predicted TIM-barrel fold metal-dependent hydrolase
MKCRNALAVSAVFLSAACAIPRGTPRLAPIADHHQHLFSPDLAALLAQAVPDFQPITAQQLIALLDSAGIERALVLSPAYIYSSPSRNIADDYTKVKAENDWIGAQVSQYPTRLRGFCGLNPLKDYALDEIERCSRIPNMSRGIKLHFGNSDVQLENPEHIEKLRRVFRAANDHHMAIVVHMRASISRQRPYGAIQARAFLEQVLPSAPDVVVQVAHLAGTGPGYEDPPADSAMAVLADAVEHHDPRTRNLWFDVATVVNREITPPTAALVVKRIRQVGVDRVLYGSDAAAGTNLRPREGWTAFRRIPLTEADFEKIAGNLAPYMR